MITETTRRGTIATVAGGVVLLIAISAIALCQSELIDPTLHAEQAERAVILSDAELRE